MAFEYVRLSPQESARFRQRMVGPVLGFAQSCAIDHDTGAVLIALGGKPDLEPERGEPPGHYNLLWNDCTVAGTGHYNVEKRQDAYVYVLTLALHVPKGLAGELDRIRQLIDDGMVVLFSGMARRPTSVEVVYEPAGHV